MRRRSAFAIALGLHALLALALGRLRMPLPRPRAPRPTALVEVTTTPPHVAPLPSPPPSSPPSPPAPSGAQRRRHASPIATAPPPAPTSSAPSPSEPAASEGNGAAPRGPAELFPRAVLEGVAARGTPAHGERAAGARHDTPAGDLDDAVAAARTRSGQVAPVWREIERELVQSFKPPVDAVHDTPARGVDRFADRVKTWFKQEVAVVARGEEGLRHPVEPGSTIVNPGPSGSIDPSQEVFQGTPEGFGLKAMPLAQQQAAAAAAEEPARWLRVEVEIAIDAAGQIADARVVVPSGRRAFDRYALATVRAEVTRAAPPSTSSRWVCEAGYAVSRPDAVGVTFDVQMLFDKKLRKQLAARYPGKERVDTRVSLSWVKPLRDAR